MASSLKEALKNAFANKGIALPEAKKVEKNRSKLNHPYNSNNKNIAARAHKKPHVAQVEKKGLSPDNGIPGSDVYTRTKTTAQNNLPKEVEIEFSVEIPTYTISNLPDKFVYKKPEHDGSKTQICDGKSIGARELVIGLDFGTSSTKIVIGDSDIDKAFAVEFSEALGVEKFLLPSRLYKQDTKYSLSDGATIFRDLKLGLLANENDIDAQDKVVVFLALVLKHTRAWFFENHGLIYKSSKILWKLAVGLPSANHLNGDHKELFSKLSTYAWQLSLLPVENITDVEINKVREIPFNDLSADPDFAEISIVPEIAAQIFGFVSSNSFDKDAKNIYLMVDIGAGTVDSSLFHVKPAKAGKWSFTFYKTDVDLNGVMNLHRMRVDWWSNLAAKYSDKFNCDLNSIRNSKFDTDKLTAVPESYLDYFTGVTVRPTNDPDHSFFMQKVVAQARGRTMWRAWKDGYLSQDDLYDTPMFLCGGGARMKYYRALETEMRHPPNCSWLLANPRPLIKPSDLIAPNLPEDDFDRLSVAYGLSFLEVNAVLQGIPAPKTPARLDTNYDDNFVSKDQM
jgi:hypothetical protein